MTGLGRRVRQLEMTARNRAEAAEGITPILILIPSSWSAEDQAAYRAAEEAHDWDAHAEVIARATGQRPAAPGDPRQIRIVITERSDGPQ